MFDLNQHLAVLECGESSSSGPDLDPNKSTVYKNSLVCRKVEKAKGKHVTSKFVSINYIYFQLVTHCFVVFFQI